MDVCGERQLLGCGFLIISEMGGRLTIWLLGSGLENKTLKACLPSLFIMTMFFGVSRFVDKKYLESVFQPSVFYPIGIFNFV